MNTSVACPEGAFMVWKTSACSSKSQIVYSQSILVFKNDGERSRDV